MPAVRNRPKRENFNGSAHLPFQLRLEGFEIADFRRNLRGELGTRTATLHREGILKLRGNWIYREPRA